MLALWWAGNLSSVYHDSMSPVTLGGNVGWMDGWMDGWMMDGSMDGWFKAVAHNCHSFSQQCRTLYIVIQNANPSSWMTNSTLNEPTLNHRDTLAECKRVWGKRDKGEMSCISLKLSPVIDFTQFTYLGSSLSYRLRCFVKCLHVQTHTWAWGVCIPGVQVWQVW